MIIGVPKEITINENRVSITPAGTYALAQSGHKVLIEKNAGLNSGFSDEDYTNAGASIVDSPEEVYKNSQLILKVKAPLSNEVGMLKDGQMLFSYLHLAAEPELTNRLIAKGSTSIAYETVQLNDGSLPLLNPMSEVAGRMSILIGSSLLSKASKGSGILLSGVPGVKPAKVTILGAGVVGINAAKMAVGLGADVTILNRSPGKLKYLEDIYESRIKTLILNEYSLAESVKEADLVIGAVLIPGGKAPKLVKEYMVKSMKEGSVIVDVAIDQGGCVETITHPTTHDNPTYEKYGVIHYSVANMPGTYARTSTLALTNVTLPYVIQLADKGFEEIMKIDEPFAKGVNIFDGKCTYESLASSLNLEYKSLKDII